MLKSEKGFSTPIALTVIFSLCLMTVSIILLVYSEEKKINSYKRQVVAKKNAEKLLQNIGEDIQSFIDEEYDLSDTIAMKGILTKYKQYDISLVDVSTGINTEFLKDEILESKEFIQYLASDDAQLSDYGWINPKYTKASKIEEIEKDFGSDELFPLICEFPLYNLFEMKTDFLTVILSFNKIRHPEDKAEIIKSYLPDDLNIKKLCEILDIQKSHSVFDFLGTKTVFWKVNFKTEECEATAVFAAVPQKNDKKKIDKYVLVERNISYKGGLL